MNLFILFLIGILTTASQAACPGVKMFKGTQQVINFSCTLHPTNSCKNGPSQFPVHLRKTSSATSLSEPRDFSVTTWRRNTEVQGVTYNAAGLTFKWKVPADLASRNRTKGYYLNLQRAGSGSVICRLVDLTNTSLTSSADYNFELTLFPLGSYDNFLINIYSLPVPNGYGSVEPSNQNIITVEGPRSLSPAAMEPGKWTTWINIVSYSGHNKIRVQFGLPDASMPQVHFNKYQLSLVRVGQSQPAQTAFVTIQNSSNNATSAFYNFTGVSSGQYYVQILPKDIFARQDSKCHCWRRTTYIPRICGACTSSHTTDFNFTAMAPSTEEEAHNGESNTILIVAVPTLGVITIGVVLALTFNFIRKDRSRTQKVENVDQNQTGEEKN